MMKNRRNYYRVLQVQPDAPFQVIRASYHTLMRELKQHPDLGGDHWNAKILNEAYATLQDKCERAAYDKYLYERYNPNVGDSRDERIPLTTTFCPFCRRPLARKSGARPNCPTCKSPLRADWPQDADNACRRTVSRIRKKGKIRFYMSWPQKGVDAELVDISPRGMRFRTRQNVLKSASLKFSSDQFRAVGTVKNNRKLLLQGRTLYEVGVEFVTIRFLKERGGFYSANA
jgi:curved DNA-binding protein CbpA